MMISVDDGSRLGMLGLIALIVVGCASSGDDGDPSSDDPPEQRHPDVLDVTVEKNENVYNFTVTISSPYDTPDRYANGWRIVDDEGRVYGEHTLAHDHATEQPFTRIQKSVEIPSGVDRVTVEGHDTEHGYGGETVTITLP